MLTVQQQLEAYVRQAPPVAVALGVGLATYALVRLATGRKKNSYPYPRPASTLPVLGNTLDLMVYNRDRMYEFFAEQCAALERPWLLSIVGSDPVIVVSSPEILEDVLKTQSESFAKEADGGVKVMEEFFGNGILAAGGDAWYFHRKTASNLFSHQMMRDVMYEAVRSSLEVLERALHVYEARGEPVNIKAVIAHFTSDVFGKIGFGVDLNCIENGVAGKPGNEFIEAFSTASTAQYRRYRQPMWLWRLKRYLNVGEEKLMAQKLKIVNDLIFRVIDESIEKKKKADAAQSDGSEATAPPPKDLISLFLSSTIKEDEHIKAKEFKSEAHLIRDTVVNFIFAGKDTTSNAISFFIIAMNKYPHVLAKIRDELREKLPGLLNGKLATPSMDDLAQLTYLEAAIRENLRVHTVASLTPRVAIKDVVLCDGTPIPKGTRVTIAMTAGHKRKATWGNDVLEFKPERWLDADTGKILPISPYKAVAFLAGPRQCIGMKFALMEMKCTLAVLMSRYDLKTTEDPWSYGYTPGVTTSVKGSLMVDLKSITKSSGAAVSA